VKASAPGEAHDTLGTDDLRKRRTWPARLSQRQRKHARTGRASHYGRSSVRAGVLGGRAETLVGEGAVDVRVVGDGAQAEVLRGQVDRGRPEGARCSARRPAADRASSWRRRSSGSGIRRAPASAETSWEGAGPETPARRARSAAAMTKPEVRADMRFPETARVGSEGHQDAIRRLDGAKADRRWRSELDRAAHGHRALARCRRWSCRGRRAGRRARRLGQVR
jgi:hypothetical protein